MDEKMVTLKLTYEEARLLSDSFSMSYIQDDEDQGIAALAKIGDKISTAMAKCRAARPQESCDE